MEAFLKVEYESCLGLVRYYDERHQSLVKFSTAISSSVTSLIFGFRTFGAEAHTHFWSFAAALSGVAALGLLVIFVAMVQNRLYFVYPVRQVNAIRRAMRTNVASEFVDNQMYLSSAVRAFKFLSLHSLMNALVAAQVGVFVGVSWLALNIDAGNMLGSIHSALLVGTSFTVVAFVLSAVYLHMNGRSNADRSVHRVKGDTE